MPVLFPFLDAFLSREIFGLTLQIWLVYALVIAAAISFFREWANPDVIALGALAGAFLFVLGPDELIGVFGNRAPITIACMFVLSAALERTGAIDWMGGFFEKIAGKTELRVMFTLMSFAAVLSAFVNNTPVVVVFLPIVNGLAKRLDLNPSRLLIPLSFASILGGTCTLTGTSTNLIIDHHVREYGLEGFGMFELAKIGVIYAIVGFIYLGTVGRKLLPNRKTLEQTVEPPATRSFLTQFSVEAESPLVGKTLPDTLLKAISDGEVLEVRRRGRVLDTPLDKLEIRANDRLLVMVHGTSFEELRETQGIRFTGKDGFHLRELETRELKLMEGIVGPHSSLEGKTLREARFRQRYGVHILAIHRQGRDLRRKKDVREVTLRFGDTLLLEGPVDAINRLQRGRDFVVMNERDREERSKGLMTSVGITVAFVLAAAISPAGIPAFALMAALALIFTKCLTTQIAYQAVQWDIVFLIIGMLALGLAMEKSQAAQELANGVTALLGNASPYVWLSVIYLLSSLLTEMISNNAVAALLTPVILGIAAGISTATGGPVDPRPLIVAMMLGCSASFATPIGYQTNTYVYGAGGYRFSDFPKIGIPLNLLLWAVATFLVPVFWKF
ncbi:MAG: SLC13 family permease [Verrucomicrobiota bacterium]